VNISRSNDAETKYKSRMMKEANPMVPIGRVSIVVLGRRGHRGADTGIRLQLGRAARQESVRQVASSQSVSGGTQATGIVQKAKVVDGGCPNTTSDGRRLRRDGPCLGPRVAGAVDWAGASPATAWRPAQRFAAAPAAI
jgi:hypothetical protein